MKFLAILLTSSICFSSAFCADGESKKNSNLPSNASALELTESFVAVTSDPHNRSHWLISFYPNLATYVQEQYDHEIEGQEKNKISTQSETEEIVEIVYV